MRPDLPRIPTHNVDELSPEWITKLVNCVEYAMNHPKGDGKTTYESGGTIHALRQSANAPGGESGDNYEGYFKVSDASTPAVPEEGENPAQEAEAKIKISAGLFLHGLAKKVVEEAEVTVTAGGAVYLKVVWNNTDYVCTFEYASDPTNINGTTYIEICSFDFADSKTSNLTQKQYGAATAPSGLL